MPRIVYKGIDLAVHDAENLNIAFGAIIGFHLGLLSPWTIQWILAFMCLLVFRVNLLATAAMGFFAFGLATLCEPGFHKLGLNMLIGYPSLYSIWGWMHHLPIIPYSGFHNTVVLGSTLSAYALTIPLFFIFLASSNRIRRILGNMWYATKLSRSYSHYARSQAKK